MTDFIKNFSEFLVFLIFRAILPKPKYQSNNLLLFNSGLIGDLIVSSVLLENPNIFNNYDKVYFLIKEEYLELFKNYNGKVEFVEYNYKKYKFSLLYKFKLLSNLRKKGFYTAIHLTAARGILNEELIHSVGARELIVLNSFWEYLGNNLGKYFDKKYTIIIAKDILNEYDKHFELIKYLTSDDVNIVFNNGVTFGEQSNINIDRFAKYNDAIVIAPFSSLMNREWKKEYYFEVINKLKEEHRIVLLGSAKQKSVLEEFRNENSNIKILAGELKLFEIPLLLKHAKLFVGQDSGLTHMALKMETPLIAIIGGGEFGRFFPYRESEKVKFLYEKMDCFLCHWECSKKEMFCLTNVVPRYLLDEIEKILLTSHEN